MERKYAVRVLAIFAILAVATNRTVAFNDLLEIMVKHSQDFMKNSTECRAKVGATDADMAVFMAKKLPDTKTGDCMIACMMEKLGSLSADGKFAEDAPRIIAHSVLGEDDEIAGLIGDVGKACSKEITADDQEKCSVAKKLAECGLKHVKKFKEAVKKDK